MKKSWKIVLCLCLALALILGLCACGDDAPKPAGPKSNSIADRYIYAQELLGAGQYADAAAAFDAVGDYEDAAKLAMYAKAAALGESGQYDAAIDAFNSFGDYKSSADMAVYYGARREQADGDYSSAIKRYNKIILFKDSAQRVEECKQAMYEIADSYAEQGNMDDAYYAFSKLANTYGYADSRQRADAISNAYSAAVALEQAGQYQEAVDAYEALGNYEDCYYRTGYCREQIRLKADYDAAVALQQAGQYEEAIAAFEALGDYKDCDEQIKETNYLKAKSLLEKKDYAGAYAIFINLKGYKDVDNLLSTDDNLKAAAAREAKLKQCKTVGSYVTYGTYPQTAAGNDSTPIEWLVLDYDEKNNRALLISRYGLDCQPYNTKYTDVTWETCSLRTWLNGTFLNKAFSKAEQGAILTTKVDNSSSQCYSGWSTNGGNNTQDKIFLLSYAESNKYFNVTYSDSNNTKSRVAPTAYAIARGAWTSLSNKTADGSVSGYWWLRSPGINPRTAAVVFTGGSHLSNSVRNYNLLVRPAFWLDLSAIEVEGASMAGETVSEHAESNEGTRELPDEAVSDALSKQDFTVGSYVTYGTYPQTAAGNDSTPIEWLVLEYDAKNSRALLISRYGLDCQKYNRSYTSVTWETCSLRTWLNGTFLNKAFSKAEQGAILTTEVDNSSSQCYSGWSTNGGNNTQDKIFLLSYAEANKYFNVEYCNVSGADRNTKSRVTPTAYAIARGAWTSLSNKAADGSASGYWWLRSPGYYQTSAARVYTGGSLSDHDVDDLNLSVRPAFWLDLSGI